MISWYCSHNIPPLLRVSYTQSSNKNTINSRIEIILVKNVNCECVHYTHTFTLGYSKIITYMLLRIISDVYRRRQTVCFQITWQLFKLLKTKDIILGTYRSNGINRLIWSIFCCYNIINLLYFFRNVYGNNGCKNQQEAEGEIIFFLFDM